MLHEVHTSTTGFSRSGSTFGGVAAPNTTLAADSYVPVLKCKQGELGAIGSTAKDLLVPLVEVPSSAKAAALAAAWLGPDVILVQPFNLDEADDPTWAAEVDSLFAALRGSGACAVPVATTDDGPDTVAALGSAAATDGRGACMRIEAEDIALSTPAVVAGEVNQLLADLGVGANECDLVLDVGLVRSSRVARVTAAEAGLRVLPHLADWRNLACVFSAFPESLNDVAAKSTVTAISRDDAVSYAALLSRSPERVPLYGDYAVGTPFYVDIPWAPIPAIRYAAGLNWMIHRGATKNDRSAQYVSLSTDVSTAAHFAGAGVSAGDQYFSDVAAGLDGPGNPTTFVRAATSRHLACVLDRLATLGVP